MKASKKSAERRKKLHKEIKETHDRTLKIMKVTKGVSKKELGKMLRNAWAKEKDIKNHLQV